MTTNDHSTVAITVDARQVRVTAGVSVAAALLSEGVQGFRRSVSGEPRAPLCGMGICYECRVTIDDIPHQRACLLIVEDGMVVRTTTE